MTNVESQVRSNRDKKDIAVQFAQKAVIVSEDRVLLVRKSASDPQQPGKWELPGGRMKDAEDVDEHLKREVFEEVGLEVDPGEPLDMWSWEMTNDGKTVRVVAVARRCSIHSGRPTLRNNEEDDHLASLWWHPIDQIVDLNVIPSQRHVFDKIASSQPRKLDKSDRFNLIPEWPRNLVSRLLAKVVRSHVEVT